MVCLSASHSLCYSKKDGVFCLHLSCRPLALHSVSGSPPTTTQHLPPPSCSFLSVTSAAQPQPRATNGRI